MTAPDDGAIEKRFWEKVAVAGDGECWLWTACITKKGYAQFGIGRRHYQAHRVSYEMANGPIPEGMQVDHRCRNRACVNPRHLRLATNKQNNENLGVQRNSRSGVRGVSWNTRNSRWEARVEHDGRKYFGGYHTTIEEAKAAAIELRNRLFTYNVEEAS